MNILIKKDSMYIAKICRKAKLDFISIQYPWIDLYSQEFSDGAIEVKFLTNTYRLSYYNYYIACYRTPTNTFAVSHLLPSGGYNHNMSDIDVQLHNIIRDVMP